MVTDNFFKNSRNLELTKWYQFDHDFYGLSFVAAITNNIYDRKLELIKGLQSDYHFDGISFVAVITELGTDQMVPILWSRFLRRFLSIMECSTDRIRRKNPFEIVGVDKMLQVSNTKYVLWSRFWWYPFEVEV